MDYDKVRELFNYKDGNLYWKIRPANNVQVGDLAGAMGPRYFHIGYGKRKYYTHLLVWLWHYGSFPENEIDHIDRNPLNNRIENLREVTHKQNIRNCGNSKNNTSGVCSPAYVYALSHNLIRK